MQNNEGKWLQQAQRGDATAFASLVEMYAKPVYNMCYRMLGHPQDAEDAAQETFLRAFRNLHRYDPERKFATWLLSIAANHCIDQHRRVRPQLVELGEDGLEPAERGPGPEGRALASEASDEVQALLAGLQPRDRVAIILHYWYDYSYAEIAGQLSTNEGALKARMHRARRSLAAAWQDKHGEPIFTQKPGRGPGRRLYEKAKP